jgi:hypothetical protein
MVYNIKDKISMIVRIWWVAVMFFTISFIDTGCDKVSDNSFISPETVHGVVKDMSGTNGCGLVIELDDGTVIVPYQLDTSMTLAEGQEVEIAYTEIPDTVYSCGAGVVADIKWLEQYGCGPIIMQKSELSSVSNKLPSDPFVIGGAKIIDDCLEISLSFSGGCEAHEFIMAYQELPKFEKYSGKLTLGHNSHGDMCEAYITRTVSFNLAPLQKPEKDMIRLILVKEGDKAYQLIIDYYYKK